MFEQQEQKLVYSSNQNLQPYPQTDSTKIVQTLPQFNRSVSFEQREIVTNNNINDEQDCPIPLQRNFSLNNDLINNQKVIKEIKKRKIKLLTIQPEAFMPDLFVAFNTYKAKHIIRCGLKYQAQIPRRNPSTQIVKSVTNLRLWSKDYKFDDRVYQYFKANFGQKRNEEQLCQLFIQFNTTWDRFVEEMEINKEYLKKHYALKDKNRVFRE